MAGGPTHAGEISSLQSFGRISAFRKRPEDGGASLNRRTPGLNLAEEINFRQIDDFIAASVENGRQHEKAKVLGLFVGDGWRH